MNVEYKAFRKSFLICAGLGMATTCGYTFGHQPPKIEIMDVDTDGSIDAVIDANWKFELLKDRFKKQNFTDYKICSLTEEIPFASNEKELRDKLYPLIADCLASP